MGMNVLKQLLDEAVRLPEDQRLTLAHRLLMVGEPHASEDIEQAWDVEIRERIARYDHGELRTRPAGDVFNDIDQRLKK
ncbi:MAG: addiction module antitoxin RelB [Desulfuromusa sp.]|nr:addiction module antitoxin RelB [Desulfuromusa sp.]